MSERLKKRIRQAMDRDKDDDFEIAFKGLSPEEMQGQYGFSGRTRKEILDDYRRSRVEWTEASKLLDELLA